MTAQAATIDQSLWQTWRAHLYLDFDRTDRGTRLCGVDHEGPLYVQRPFYPEGKDWAHIYLLHPPGGMVSGDLLEMRLRLASGANVLATTPGAGRAYGARDNGSQQRQRNLLEVEEGAVLEWFPMENIVYSGADLDARTQVSLRGDARFVGWEINCLGLPASRFPFAHGSLRQHLQINLNDLPVFVDQLRLNASDTAMLSGFAGLAGSSVSGTFLAGPFVDEKALKELVGELQQDDKHQLLGLTQSNRFLIGRYLGGSAFQARTRFADLWAEIRPVFLNRPSCAPRIWAT